jgi:hypothetical protein
MKDSREARLNADKWRIVMALGLIACSGRKKTGFSAPSVRFLLLQYLDELFAEHER